MENTMQFTLFLLATAALVLSASMVRAQSPATRPADAKNILDLTAQDISGKDVPLSRYKGKVLLIVNVASKCGNTPQYANLEQIFEKYKDKGLAILAFPANEFGGQEPGTNEQIQAFCTSTYNVKFDLFSKVKAKGDGQHPVFQFLTDKATNPVSPGAIKWNFTKFLISRDGQIAARFEPKVKPDEPEVIKAIEAELAK
jgi:glutathione peroxidase